MLAILSIAYPMLLYLTIHLSLSMIEYEQKFSHHSTWFGCISSSDPSEIENVKSMIFLMESVANPEDVYASVPEESLTDDTRLLLELGLGVQTDRTVHMLLMMQDIAEKHGNISDKFLRKL